MHAASALLDRARAGRPGALFILAEAGLGKTSSLNNAMVLPVANEFAVGLGRGDAMESALPFGLLAQAISGLGGQDVLEGSGSAAIGPDLRAARFYAVRRWLEGAAATPVLLALDDLHWADADSLALLSFLCRRLASLPVAIIATLRPWPSPAQEVAATLTQDGYAAIEQLSPLTWDSAAALITARAGRAISDAALRRCADLCSGNPLLLEQVALAVARGEDVPHPVSGGSRGTSEDLLLARFAGLPAAGLRCAQAGAVFGMRFWPDLAVSLAGLDRAAADVALDALGRSGLVRPGPASGVEFVHALFGQALYDDIPGSIRARLHARAFSLLVERGLYAEAVEHAIKGELAGDGKAIEVMERVGRAARGKGAAGTAISVLESAVAFAGEHAASGLLLDLAETMASWGRPADAVGVCERILGLPELPVLTRARALRALGQAFVYMGAFQAGGQRIEECVSLAVDADPIFAAQTLLDYSLVAWLSAGPVTALAVTSRAKDIADGCDPVLARSAASAGAAMALETGDAAGVPACEAAARAAELDLPPVSGAGWRAGGDALHWYASTAKYIERLSDSAHFYGIRLRTTEQLGLVEAEAAALVGCMDTHMRALRLDEAAVLIERCAKLSDLVPLAGPFAGVGRTNLLLLRGRLDESEELGRQVEQIVMALGAWSASLWLVYMRGWRCLVEGRLDEACGIYEDVQALMARLGLREPCEVPWARHAVAAYVRSGRAPDARRVVSWLDDCAASLPCRWPRIAAACGRGWLAESSGDQARAHDHFRAALALQDQVDLPLERLQTLLEYGRFLRRAGQPERSRRPLAEAAGMAEASGAEWLAGQARQELRIAGGRRRRRHEDPSRLTPQEERVAALAASGATNAEIARTLYLSVSTIESHLDRIYGKLGVHSRRELMLRATSPGTAAMPGPKD